MGYVTLQPNNNTTDYNYNQEQLMNGKRDWEDNFRNEKWSWGNKIKLDKFHEKSILVPISCLQMTVLIRVGKKLDGYNR